MRKRILAGVLAVALSVSCVACGTSRKDESEMGLQASKMKAICELAVVECYYHNVAKYSQDDAERFLWWVKDRRFWIEYEGIVKIGIDASRLDIKVKDEKVTISIPKVEVLSAKVDKASLNKDSYYVEKGSAKITAEDEKQAIVDAQNNMQEEASNNTALLDTAQERVETLLEEYVNNIGTAVGKDYVIEWKYLQENEGKEA